MAAPMGRMCFGVKTFRNLIFKRNKWTSSTNIPVAFGGAEPMFPLDKKKLKDEVPDDAKSLDEILRQEQKSVGAEPPPVDIGADYRLKRQRLQPPAGYTSTKEELEHKSRHRELIIPLDQVKELWHKDKGPTHVKEVAKHYGIYDDLFNGAFFYPVIDLRIFYDYDEESVTPVFRGNIIPPSEAKSTPIVEYDAEDDSLWTLLLTNPDGHLTDNQTEYLHWMVGNIPGDDVSRGEELCGYLQPFPPRGTGFHRHIFLLFKQDGKIDFTNERRTQDCTSLKERSFKTLEFYNQHADVLTPMSLSFFQSDWDKSVKNVYHHVLNMREPAFEYQHPVPYHPPHERYPRKQPFDRYYDRYRSKKDLAEEVMKMKLEMISPFKPYQEAQKYPMVHLHASDKPTWLKHREELKHRRREQFKDLPQK